MFTKKLALIGLALGFFASTAGAVPITNSATGLSAPDVTIGFDEVALVTGTDVTDQFAAFGVTFDPGVTYFTSVSPRPNFSGAAVIDFFGPAVSILFSEDLTEMVMNMSQNFGMTTFTSLLDGNVVESFTSTLDLSANNFYGFSNSLFDEVIVDPSGSSSVAMDNLSYSVATAAVPLPGTLPLFLGALGLLAVSGRRRRVN